MNRLREHLREAVLICSSSRGGSSISTEWLRQHRGLLHLRAEINPLLHLAKLVYPHANSSDALGANHGTLVQRATLWELLSREIGFYHTDNIEPSDWTRFVFDLQVRFQWQWPRYRFSQTDIRDAVVAVRRSIDIDTKIPSLSDFYCLLLRFLRRKYPLIDPRWYDLDEQTIVQHFPDLGILHAPQKIIEEPPFVLIAPWKIASVADLQTKPLVIKTPSNAYRIPFFRDFFERQTLKILHLKRRAEHAINGLMDGWMYPRGFHAHWIDTVAIDHPAVPPKLWKYDLPPNWSRVQTAELHEVCAFQWCQAHRYTLQDRHYADSYHSIWFGDLLDNSPQAIRSLWKWLRVIDEPIRPISDLPLVMATCPPRSQRWFAKKEIITQRCSQKDIKDYMEQLREAQ